MANLDSVHLLSEAAYGCGMYLLSCMALPLDPDRTDPQPPEHLAAVLTDQQTAGQFKNGFRKHFESLAPYTKPDAVAVQITGLRTVASLKPKYHCLTCSETCLNTERKAHTKKTGHVFCMSVVSS